MGSLSKGVALVLILTVTLSVLSLLITKPANAQAIPKPSVPEFTLKLADHSYDLPPTTSTTTDPYNGKTITTTIPGYHVTNITIDLTIKNQPFPSTINGNASNLYYNIRIKGNFGQEWNYPYSSFPTWASSNSDALVGNYSHSLPAQSTTGYTVLSFPSIYRVGDQVDFQVEAILGIQYVYSVDLLPNNEHIIPGLNYNTYDYSFVHNASGWSPTQTVTIPASSVTYSSPTPTPTVPEFPILAILPLFVILLLISIKVRHRKNAKA